MRKSITSLRQELTDSMSDNDESWADVLAHTLTEKELDEKLDNAHGGDFGLKFTLWTKNLVYYPVVSDDWQYIDFVARNPSAEAIQNALNGQTKG